MTEAQETKHEQTSEPEVVQAEQQSESVDTCCGMSGKPEQKAQEAATDSGTDIAKDDSGKDKTAELEQRCKELQDQYLRKAADFDNYRKRMIREKQEALTYANTNILTDLLQILDDFDRAIEAGGQPEENTPIAAFAKGVTMIRTSMVSLLESKYDLHYFESKGTLFDPAIHEAVATAPSKEVVEPTVGEELQKGYMLKDRVLRPAKVMVLMPEPENADKKEE